jgi:thiol-disulfide isomerase/thioredoxin
VRRRLIAGLALGAVGAPLAWLAVTRPLAGPGGVAILGGGGPAKGVGPLPDHEAPNFRLKDATGKSVELKQFRGSPVLLNFWATWCLPCRDELPEMEQLYRRYGTGGFIVLAVSIDSEAAAKDVPVYLKEGDPKVGAYTFPVGLDTKQEVARLYKLGGVPASFFIDPAGVIRAVQPGAMNHQILLDRVRTILPSVDA